MHRDALDTRIAIAQRRPDGGGGCVSGRRIAVHSARWRTSTAGSPAMASVSADTTRSGPRRTSASMARRHTAGRGSARRPISAAGDVVPPVETTSARIGHRRRAALPHAVDRAQHVRLRQLRRRATQLVPGAGVDDEQAAVGVLDDVGRVEVEAVGDEEVGVACW